jgi:hypothetical protein
LKSKVHSSGSVPLGPPSGVSSASALSQLYPAFRMTLTQMVKKPHPRRRISYGGY